MLSTTVEMIPNVRGFAMNGTVIAVVTIIALLIGGVLSVIVITQPETTKECTCEQR